MIRLVISLTLSYLSARISQDYGLYAFTFNFILIYLIISLSKNTQYNALFNHYVELIKTKKFRIFVTYLIQGIILKNSNLLNLGFTTITAVNMIRYLQPSVYMEQVVVFNAVLFACLIIIIGTVQKTLEGLNLGSKLTG